MAELIRVQRMTDVGVGSPEATPCSKAPEEDASLETIDSLLGEQAAAPPKPKSARAERRVVRTPDLWAESEAIGLAIPIRAMRK